MIRATFTTLFFLSCGQLALVSASENAPSPPPPKEVNGVPDGVDPTMTSRDPLFGLTREKPVRVGSRDELGGPKAQREYFESLRDGSGHPVEFRRVGNAGPGPHGSIVDIYEVKTRDGETTRVYIDMYHPDHAPANQPAPAGFFKAELKTHGEATSD